MARPSQVTRLSAREFGGLALALLVGVGLRLVLLGQPGLAGDLDDFAAWTAAIAHDGLGRAYDQPISFPPVMPWIWAGLGVVAPLVASGDAGDPAVIAAMKLPATLADLALAGLVGLTLRTRPRWAIAGIAAILVHPGIAYVSAWWGQYESIYVLPIVAAVLAVGAGRRDLAAVLVAVALMTKPQALPLVVPLGAFLLATAGWRGAARATAVGVGTIVVLWAPFVPADGPTHYLEHLRTYADAVFPVISLRAWNPWWTLQIAAGSDALVVDTSQVLGPLTFRWLGLGAAAALEVALVAWVVRRPTRDTLIWALVAVAVAVPMLLTTMHERYTYPAAVLLVLLWPDRRAVALWAAHAVVFTLNLVAAVPPGDGGPGSVLPVDGLVGLAGSVAMTAIAVGVSLAARRSAAGAAFGPAAPRGTSVGTAGTRPGV